MMLRDEGDAKIGKIVLGFRICWLHKYFFGKYQYLVSQEMLAMDNEEIDLHVKIRQKA